jgi:thiosulfate/3-mercaptopyruvate sulfurtransferase
MKRFITVLSILVFSILIIMAFFGDRASAPPDQPASSPSVDAEPPEDKSHLVTIDAVIEALRNPDDWVVIDVRTPEEFNGETRLPNAYGSGRLKGAVNVNKDLAFSSEGELLARDELVKLYEFIGDRKAIVYCHGGARSDVIWKVLTDLGFDALHYNGSWIDWSRAASIASGSPNDVVLDLTEEWTDNKGEIL